MSLRGEQRRDRRGGERGRGEEVESGRREGGEVEEEAFSPWRKHLSGGGGEDKASQYSPINPQISRKSTLRKDSERDVNAC